MSLIVLCVIVCITTIIMIYDIINTNKLNKEHKEKYYEMRMHVLHKKLYSSENILFGELLNRLLDDVNEYDIRLDDGKNLLTIDKDFKNLYSEMSNIFDD